jgi:hypothetical protein
MHFEGSEEKDFFFLFPRLFGSRQTINQVFNDFPNFSIVLSFVRWFVRLFVCLFFRLCVTNGKNKTVFAAERKKNTHNHN